MNIIKHGRTFLALSGLILLPGIVSLIVYGLNFSIDFTGGSVFEFRLTDAQNYVEEVSNEINAQNIEIGQFLVESDDKLVIRTKPLEVAEGDSLGKVLSEKIPSLTLESFETVGPSIGTETAKNSVKALLIATVAIVIYIAYAFRNVRKPLSSWKFGVSAIIAMIHDALVVIGAFSILGKFYNYQVDALFITALLTVIGFSVHDTIVVYDRIRENLSKLPKTKSFAEIANFSLVETLNRSLTTSLTVIVTLVSLLILGGESVKHFVMALLIGIVSGTYSSIFTATPILVLWESKKTKKN